jgi:aquaporin Z
VRHALDDAVVRRILMGVAMGATAAAIIYSPLGARSGAHMNPAVTLAFLSLGRIRPRDAAGYITAQFAGALAGTLVALAAFGGLFTHPAVNFVQTLPGAAGIWAAAAGELAISFLTLSVLLAVSARSSTMRLTGLAAGVVVMLDIAIEDPLSGMSMNPARSLAPALVSGNLTAIWIYLLVPPLAMQLSAVLHRALQTPGCAKLNHSQRVRCLFCGA